MSLVLEILEGAWNTTLRYKGSRVNLFGVHRPNPYKKSTINNTVSRLHRLQLIQKEDGVWKITEKGKKFIEKDREQLPHFKSPFKYKAPKNFIVMFDISEDRNLERDWLRRQLKKFDYIMIQRSVWVGPSPLPDEFRNLVKKIKLDSCIKTFKLAKPYTTKTKSTQL
jgi:CRISPR-associated endonuclease Cas2